MAKPEDMENEVLEETEAVPDETAGEATDEAAEPEVSKEEELTEQLKEWEDKYMRLFAEFDNFKKRSQKEKDARYGDAVLDTVSAFLPVVDNLERALAITVETEEAKKVLEGVELVLKQVSETLTKLEVKEIPALGEKFDPNLHNAVMHIEDESMDENVVIEEFMKGYIYKDERVVRHSMVKVAN